MTASLVFGGAVLWMLIALPVGDPLRAAATIAARPNRHDLRPDRDLCAPGLDRPDLRVLLRLQARDRSRSPGYCDFINPIRRDCGGPVQWAYHLVLPWMTFAILFAALYVRMIRANVMETLERGLRPHGARQGRARVAGHALARAAQRAAPGRHDARDGHRHRARRRDLHRVGLRPARARPDARFRPSRTSTCRSIQGVVVFATLCDHHLQPDGRPVVRLASTRESGSTDERPSSRSTTSRRTSGRTTASCARSTASRSPSRRARRSASSASPAPARASPA